MLARIWLLPWSLFMLLGPVSLMEAAAALLCSVCSAVEDQLPAQVSHRGGKSAAAWHQSHTINLPSLPAEIRCLPWDCGRNALRTSRKASSNISEDLLPGPESKLFVADSGKLPEAPCRLTKTMLLKSFQAGSKFWGFLSTRCGLSIMQQERTLQCVQQV